MVSQKPAFHHCGSVKFDEKKSFRFVYAVRRLNAPGKPLPRGKWRERGAGIAAPQDRLL